eukprot:COSAG01_NODE_52_length_31456_cov_125.226648_1_plen_643_part_10
MNIINLIHKINAIEILTIDLTTILLITLLIAASYLTAPLILNSIIIAMLALTLNIDATSFKILLTGLLILNIPFIRTILISLPIMKLLKKLALLPVISETERTALEAGDTWIDAELFSGKADFNKILKQKDLGLSKEEQAFLDGPTETLCEMIDDWEIHQNRDFNKKTWDYLKKEKFFGLIIPKAYGGLEFSARAHSDIIKKIASRSSPVAITAMVPNSLGPAELLIHYGTEEQKNHYLPKLAIGEEIPCFALTESHAGSDAGAMRSEGVVFKEDDQIKIKINWKKRYITLAAISTVLGLAFKLRDPDNILEMGENIGITCALIPSDSKGITKNERHDPLGVPFFNCPIEGDNVIINIDQVIGGRAGIGKGWKMLMECLAAGRGISLPATCTAGIQYVTRITTAYTNIREQFSLPIGKFEGIKEPLAYMTGMSYIMEAARKYTCIALDQGKKPSVISAIMKYHSTEEFRTCLKHSMDILGGAAISKGPKNLLSNSYLSAPISITVEGANILTRCLMIFGQGAVRCHPYALDLIHSLEKNDENKFDKTFFKHSGHIIGNLTRYIVNTISRGHLCSAPCKGITKNYIKKLKWASSMFACYTDIAMSTMGGNLKRKESITARFADVFSWHYLASATLWHYENNNIK